MAEFGDVLKQIRESRGMSQEEFADLLSTSKQVISRYETGQRIPKLSTVKAYSNKLGVGLSDLSGEKITNFAQRLNSLISESGISAGSFADNLGISKQAISAWQNGTRTPKQPTIATIAQYFNVCIPWLMGYDVAREHAEIRTPAKEWGQPILAAYADANMPTQENICKLLCPSLSGA